MTFHCFGSQVNSLTLVVGVIVITSNIIDRGIVTFVRHY